MSKRSPQGNRKKTEPVVKRRTGGDNTDSTRNNLSPQTRNKTPQNKQRSRQQNIFKATIIRPIKEIREKERVGQTRDRKEKNIGRKTTRASRKN